MVGSPYTIKQGDTLWGIASRKLGDPKRWRELWDHNNSDAVVRVTKTRIPDPDLIFAGQTIYVSRSEDPPRRLFAPMTGKDVKLPKFMSPAPRSIGAPPFELEFLKESKTQRYPGFTVTVTLNGTVGIQQKKAIDFATIKETGYEVKAAREVKTAFAKQIQSITVGFDQANRVVTLKCGLTSLANMPGALSTGVHFDMIRGAFVGTIALPQKKINLPHHVISPDLKIEVEIRPDAPPSPGPQTQPVPIPYPNVAPNQEPSTWEYFMIGGLIVGAVGVAVFVTFDPVIGDEPIGYAKAAAMLSTAAARFASLARPAVAAGGAAISTGVLADQKNRQKTRRREVIKSSDRRFTD